MRVMACAPYSPWKRLGTKNIDAIRPIVELPDPDLGPLKPGNHTISGTPTSAARFYDVVGIQAYGNMGDAPRMGAVEN